MKKNGYIRIAEAILATGILILAGLLIVAAELSKDQSGALLIVLIILLAIIYVLGSLALEPDEPVRTKRQQLAYEKKLARKEKRDAIERADNWRLIREEISEKLMWLLVGPKKPLTK